MSTFKEQINGQSARHLTRRITAEKGEVLVFDGLFGRQIHETFYKFLRTSGGFRWIASDAPERDIGLKWQLHLSDKAVQLPFFAGVASLVKDVTDDPPPLREVYANFNLYGEVFRPHVDAVNGITALYCANIEWSDRWQGETVFYEGGEPAYVVLPRPGRLTLFDGGLIHRGSPPTRDCYEPRLNVVFKFKAAARPAPKERRRSKKPGGMTFLESEIDAAIKRTRTESR